MSAGAAASGFFCFAGRSRPAPVAARVPDLYGASRSGVSRFRRQRTEAARGHRWRRRFLSHRLRQRASRRLSSERPFDRSVRGSREKLRAFLNAKGRPRDRVRARRHRSDQPRRAKLGPAFLREGDEIVISELEHHSTSYPGRCCANASVPNWSGRQSIRPAGLILLRSRGCYPTGPSGRGNTCVECQRRIVTDRKDRRARPFAWRQGVGRRLPGGAAHAGRHAGARLRFLRVFRPQAYGPSGIGVLYGRYDILSAMPPWQTGGGMILNVGRQETEFQDPPHRFEAAPGHFGCGRARYRDRLHRKHRPRCDPRARGGLDRLCP